MMQAEITERDLHRMLRTNNHNRIMEAAFCEHCQVVVAVEIEGLDRWCPFCQSDDLVPVSRTPK